MSAMGDIDEIKQVKYRYLRALDTKHWDEFADTLTEDIVGDYGSRSAKSTTSPIATTLVEFMRDVDARECHHRASRDPSRDHRRRRRGHRHLVSAGPGDRAGFQFHV